MGGRSVEEQHNAEQMAEERPWDLLDQHAGILNAKSARAITLKNLADSVIRETGLPMMPRGNYRGMDYKIDWDRLAKDNAEKQPAEGAQQETGNGVKFSRDASGQPDETSSPVADKETVDRIAKAGVQGLARVPEIVTVQSVADLPFRAPKDARGAILQGKMYLVADNLRSGEAVRETVAHELIGHYGLRGFFGDKLDAVLNHIYLRNPAVAKMASEWTAKNADLIKEWKSDYGITDRQVQSRAIEEAMAEIAQTGKTITGIQRLAAVTQTLLRTVGLHDLANKLEARTDAEAMMMLHKANLFVQRGLSNKSPIPDAAYPLFMVAWHGSPHDHDKFDSSKIGTGEGAQAYGHGLYFAGNRDVAEYYRRNISGADSRVLLDGKYIGAGEYGTWPAKFGISKNISEQLNDWRAQIESGSGATLDDAPKSLRNRLQTIKQGRLYQVELAPKEDEYLLWEKPLSEQSEKVKAALNIANKELGFNGNGTGETFYRAVSDSTDLTGEGLHDKNLADKFASEYLHSLGIRGIKYMDGSSRNKQYEVVLSTSKGEYARNQFDRKQTADAYAAEKRAEGFDAKVQDNESAHHNYVIFNDKDVGITAKFSRAYDRLDDRAEQVRLIQDKLDTSRADAEEHFNIGDRIDPDTGDFYGGGGAAYSREEGAVYNGNYNPESFKTDEAHRAETNRLAQRIRITSGDKFDITPVALPDDAVNGSAEWGNDTGTSPASDFDLAQRIAGLFEKQVVWIKADGPFKINGVAVPGGSLANKIFVDVRSDHPAHVILGHELSHHMEVEAPEVYANLKQALSKLLRNHEEYRTLYKIDASATKDKLSKEMIGDLMGDSFSDPQFWNLVGKENPGLVRRIGDVVMKWINDLIDKVSAKHGLGSERFVSDLVEARKTLAKAVSEYALAKKGTTEADANPIYQKAYEKAATFYSQLRNVMSDAPDKIFNTGEQVKLWLQANSGKNEIKKDEIYWSGINDYLDMQKGNVSKANVLAYLDNNGVKVETKVLGETPIKISQPMRDAAQKLGGLPNREDEWVAFQIILKSRHRKPKEKAMILKRSVYFHCKMKQQHCQRDCRDGQAGILRRRGFIKDPRRTFLQPASYAVRCAMRLNKVFSTGKNAALWLQANSAKLGVKKDEIFWSGIDDRLNNRAEQVRLIHDKLDTDRADAELRYETGDRVDPDTGGFYGGGGGGYSCELNGRVLI